MNRINLGNMKMEMRVQGVDEALEKMNLLEKKLIEVKSLINEITSQKLEINFVSFDKLADDSPNIRD